MENPPAVRDLIKTFAPRGVPDIEKLLNEGTEVAVWNAREGKGTTIKMFILFISDMVNSFNVNRPMNQSQIFELAEDFATELWFVKFEEVAAFFQAIKKGVIGKVYERLDPPTIWGFWDIYALQRAEVIEIRQNAKTFSDPGSEKSGDDIRAGKVERFGDAFKQLSENLKQV